MPHCTSHEIIDMILILEKFRGNYRAAAKLYREQYPDLMHTVLRNCFQRARQGQLVRSRAQHGPSEIVRLTVLTAIAVNPNISV